MIINEAVKKKKQQNKIIIMTIIKQLNTIAIYGNGTRATRIMWVRTYVRTVDDYKRDCNASLTATERVRGACAPLRHFAASSPPFYRVRRRLLKAKRFHLKLLFDGSYIYIYNNMSYI